MGSKLHVLAMSHIEHLCPAIGVVADVSSQVMHSATSHMLKLIRHFPQPLWRAHDLS
jgi:hypothetical protein